MPAGKPSVLERFHAWWEGYDLEAQRGPIEAPGSDADVLELDNEAIDVPPDKDLGGDAAASSEWPMDSAGIAQMIWGPGFTSPGGADFVLELIRTLGLTPGTSVLEIGAGLGGGSRAIAQEFGANVAAWDPDADLAAEGTAQSVAEKLGGMASVEYLDVDRIEFPADHYQGALVRDVLYGIEDKAALLAGVVGAIKDQRDLVITDFVAAGSDPAVDSWVAGEPGPIALWDEAAARECLEGLDLDVRSVNDNTDAYLSIILRGLGAFTHMLGQRRPPRERLAPTVEAVERWARLVAALESGALRHCWITAVKT